MRVLWISLLVLVLGCLPVKADTPHQAVHVVDGDKLIPDNGWKVRLYGVDAPDQGQPLYQQAQLHLASMVDGERLEITCYHHLQQWRVCMVTSADKDLSEEMVRAGLAYDYPAYSHGIYSTAQQEAQDAKRGVWALEGGGLRPWEFRKFRSGQNR